MVHHRCRPASSLRRTGVENARIHADHLRVSPRRERPACRELRVLSVGVPDPQDANANVPSVPQCSAILRTSETSSQAESRIPESRLRSTQVSYGKEEAHWLKLFSSVPICHESTGSYLLSLHECVKNVCKECMQRTHAKNACKECMQRMHVLTHAKKLCNNTV